MLLEVQGSMGSLGRSAAVGASVVSCSPLLKKPPELHLENFTDLISLGTIVGHGFTFLLPLTYTFSIILLD